MRGQKVVGVRFVDGFCGCCKGRGRCESMARRNSPVFLLTPAVRILGCVFNFFTMAALGIAFRMWSLATLQERKVLPSHTAREDDREAVLLKKVVWLFENLV